MNNSDNFEREVAVLLTDMRQYAKLTSHMKATQIRDFIIDYQKSLKNMAIEGDSGAQEFEPFAGDASLAIFEQKQGEDRKEKCIRALKIAINIAKAVEAEQIPFTRIGIFVGDIIEAQFEKLTLRFGNIFSAASRLEELCTYFGTTILMDREIAWAQDKERKYIVGIGKITPKNFSHPIHVYSVYRPGIHKCPLNIDEERLMEFIRLKNEGIEHFIGNAQRGIVPNFSLADLKLRQAAMIFRKATGAVDIATSRISDYIHEYPHPVDHFDTQGMTIDERQSHSMGIRLLRLSQQLFKALDREFYYALVEKTHWEKLFRVEWINKGEIIIQIGDNPNGIYYLEKGHVRIEDAHGNMIAELSEGDIFGEMAYFSKEKKRNATAVATTDIVVRKISTEDYINTPILHKIFAEIAKRRSSSV